MHRPIIAAAAVLLLTGCSAGNAGVPAKESSVPVNRDIFAMDTYMNLRCYGSSSDEALSEAEERIFQLEKTMSVTDSGSDISKINASAGSYVQVSTDTSYIISKAIETGRDTGGSLDISVYPVLREWGFTTGEYHIPDDKTIASLLENVGYSNISVDGDKVSIPEGSMIDLGALVKGYTSDSVIDIFRKKGISSAIVNLGGNVQTLGTKPDGSLWKVSVRDPFETDKDMCILEIGEKAVITSGNYERFFTGSDGKNYWHIIDPSDGYPADNGLISVTVIGNSGLQCDALSTALFVCGYERACEYYSSHKDIDLILVTDDKKIFYTEGISKSFTNVSSMDTEVISSD